MKSTRKPNPVREYLRAIDGSIRRGDAREESFYPHLDALLKNMAQDSQQQVEVTVAPKGSEGPKPDFRVWDGSYNVIGYIGAKRPNTDLPTKRPLTPCGPHGLTLS